MGWHAEAGCVHRYGEVSSSKIHRHAGNKKMIEMFRTEDVISVTFPSETFLGEAIVPSLREELQKLFNEHKPSIVRFDLTDVALITSEVLGFFVTLRDRSVRVQLSNPSADVRAVVEMTRLDQLLELMGDEPTMPTD